MSLENLESQLEFFRASTKIFFKSNSRIHRLLKGLTKQATPNQQIFKARYRDSSDSAGWQRTGVRLMTTS
eukprot:12043597-Ditylum_brightwellii.AAC.3